MKHKSVIVHGPKGCGKTLHAERIAAYLGLTNIVDDWNPADGMNVAGALYLTNFHPAMLPEAADVLRYADAIDALNQKDRPAIATDILHSAVDTLTDRGATRDMDNGERSMARAVAAFNAVHGTQLTELQGWNFMVLLKISRSTAGRTHADDYTDMAGYAALAGECAQRVGAAA